MVRQYYVCGGFQFDSFAGIPLDTWTRVTMCYDGSGADPVATKILYAIVTAILITDDQLI